jgi:hypothetical protein
MLSSLHFIKFFPLLTSRTGGRIKQTALFGRFLPKKLALIFTKAKKGWFLYCLCPNPSTFETVVNPVARL